MLAKVCDAAIITAMNSVPVAIGQGRFMLRLHVFNTGWITIPEKRLYLGGENSTHTLPVLCYVIEHPQGLIVFDTGLNAAFATFPGHYAGWMNQLALPFSSLAGLNLATQMQACGLAAEKVTHVALSHLHYDHTGDLYAFPQAQRLVTRQEWAAARSPLRRVRGYFRKEFAGLDFTLLDFPARAVPAQDEIAIHGYGIDMLGDGNLILVPTFGHTPGHQSLLVFLPYGTVLLAGDVVYVREGYTKPAAQPFARSPVLAWRSLMGLRALAKDDPNALILLAHDESPLRGLSRPDIVRNNPDIEPQLPRSHA